MVIQAVAAMGTLLVFSKLLAYPVGVQAQEAKKPSRYKWNSHAVFVIGRCWHGYTLAGAGGGAEAFVWRRLTVGGDLTMQRFVGEEPTFGLLSAKAGYHFGNRQKPGKLDPFIDFIVGSAFTKHIMVSSAGVGGGLNYWFRDRLGLRAEGRFQMARAEEGLYIFRIGLSFR